MDLTLENKLFGNTEIEASFGSSRQYGQQWSDILADHLDRLTDAALIVRLRQLNRAERRVTVELLHHLNELERRRCYAGLGFTSAFDFLTRDLGYSESAAWRRIQAARLLRAVPDAAGKIESGSVNLTTLAQAQTAIKAEEKRTGEKLSIEKKSAAVAEVETASSRQAEPNLNSMFPEVAREKEATRESVRSVGDDHVRAHVTLTREQMSKLERLKEVLSHRNFGASLAEIIEAAADELLERRDPLRKVVKARKTTQCNTGAGVALRDTKAISPSTRNFIFHRDEGKCQFQNQSGVVCGSRFQVEIDHTVPRAHGGGNESKNLRLLCRTHNLHAAEVALGRHIVDSFRKN